MNGLDFSCDVEVLGAGITGLTTAVVLQSLGLKVRIVAEHVPRQLPDQYCPAAVSTGYAMASAYPHNLRVENLSRISADSQELLRALETQPQSGVATYRLFEVFEQEPQAPALGEHRMRLQRFDGTPEKLRDTFNPPARPGAEHLWGWVFDTYFADMPMYLKYLSEMFLLRGGCFRNAVIDRLEDVGKRDVKAVFNCLGLGAKSLCNDSAPAVVVRGKQVVVPGAPILKQEGRPVSYNYTPLPEVFSRGDGGPEYVHFFPRHDGWILGQTREPGVVNDDGEWHGVAVKSETKDIGGCQIPVPIVELNRVLLRNWLGAELEESHLHGREGYRYYRDPDGSGVRLQYEDLPHTRLIHNYGHGGSGITMSWGCALQAARFYVEYDRKIETPKSGTEFEQLVRRLVYAPAE
ncbi:MAG TPA: FAD-dependent oxidoreductase [Planktothrix sp.]